MQRRTFLALGAAVAVPAFLTACGGTMPLSPAGQVKGLTLDEVRDCLYRAGRKRAWVVRDVDEHHIEATFMKGNHVAVLDIEFDEDVYRFKVSPKTSASLLRPDGTVHRKVNQWIGNYYTDAGLLILDAKMRKYNEAH